MGKASLVAQLVKNLPVMQEPRFSPWVGKITWRKEQQLPPVFLPGEFHGQRRLAGYSPWSHKERTWLSTNTVTFKAPMRREMLLFPCLFCKWSSFGQVILFFLMQRGSLGFPHGPRVKNPPAKTGDLAWIPGSVRSPGGGNGNPLQYSCWNNSWIEEPGDL